MKNSSSIYKYVFRAGVMWEISVVNMLLKNIEKERVEFRSNGNVFLGALSMMLASHSKF